MGHGAVQVAAAKAARGHFQGAALALLEQRAIRELVTPQGHSGIDILDLTAHLPDVVVPAGADAACATPSCAAG